MKISIAVRLMFTVVLVLALVGCDDSDTVEPEDVAAFGIGHGHHDEAEQEKVRQHYADNGLVDYPGGAALAAPKGAGAANGASTAADLETYIDNVPILNQGAWNSCVSNAATLALYDALERGGIQSGFLMSVRYEWYNARMELWAGQDMDLTGTWMKSVFEAINDKSAYGFMDGIPSEYQYPCGVLDGTANNHAADYWNDMSAFAGGTWDLATLQVSYRSIALYATPDQVKERLDNGNLVLFSTMVDLAFQSVPSTGVIPLPYTWNPNDGHCMLIVGYDDGGYGAKYGYDAEGAPIGAFKVRNSWGEGWGDAGFWYLPYLFLTDYPPDAPDNPFGGESPLNNAENFVYIESVSESAP